MPITQEHIAPKEPKHRIILGSIKRLKAEILMLGDFVIQLKGEPSGISESDKKDPKPSSFIQVYENLPSELNELTITLQKINQELKEILI
jgi:hypothetical protein